MDRGPHRPCAHRRASGDARPGSCAAPVPPYPAHLYCALQLAVKEWRVRFTVAGRRYGSLAVDSGFRESQLAAAISPGSLGGTHGVSGPLAPRGPVK